MPDMNDPPHTPFLKVSRRLPVGAEVQSGGGVHFRVWAPEAARVEVVLEADVSSPGEPSRLYALEREPRGYFSSFVRDARCGARYRYRLNGAKDLPDPASRFQPEGPHGSSEIVDPGSYPWTDDAWHGVHLDGQVIYEMHVGTFTREGTWAAASRELEELAALGVTVLELMPVAEFPGRYGWGYDGVDLYAPARVYGAPDDLRRFVDRAHAAGLAVILDAVYNHIGPDGGYLADFSRDYFTERYENEWGEAINFDGERCGPVREYFVSNAGYWVDEFHIDGLRLDATQQLFDASDVHVLAEITQRVREAARGRATLVIAENEPQHTQLVRPVARGGYGMNALWNDDLHHSAMVALTGRNEGYYTDYRGTPQELISALKWGYLYQGQRYLWQKQRRGTPTFDLEPAAFVNYIQNHDQIANSGFGSRVHQLTSAGRFRAMTALMLLAPGTPMLFQGQEFAASTPFLYFADHKPELAASVKQGRAAFVAQFRSTATPEAQALLPDPGDAATFERCKLDFSERRRHAAVYALHRDLLKLRRADPVFRTQRSRTLEGAVLDTEAFVLRFFAEDGADRLLVINFGRDLHFAPAPEPLLAPPLNRRWRTLWSSEDPRYGGSGTLALDTEEGWRVPGHAAVVLVPIFTHADPL
jgi:maltooligosyltrehalose trehalohydrolase